MLVTCNNKHQYWCPYGIKNCCCNVYEERHITVDEDVVFTCTDINDDIRECRLILIPETDKELYIKKFIDMIALGITIPDAAKKMKKENITLEDFFETLSKEEFSCFKLEEQDDEVLS